VLKHILLEERTELKLLIAEHMNRKLKDFSLPNLYFFLNQESIMELYDAYVMLKDNHMLIPILKLKKVRYLLLRERDDNRVINRY